jgi:hypothetical protein
MSSVLFAIGDYAAGAVIGMVTAAAVRFVVSPGLDVAVAMVAGTAVGMVTHVVLGLALSPLLGMFHVMVPASLIGMYGGMLFAMRDSMQAVPLAQAIAVGAVFGLFMIAGIRFYDRALRDRVAGAPTRE